MSDYDKCPICGEKKTKHAKRCRQCFLDESEIKHLVRCYNCRQEIFYAEAEEAIIYNRQTREKTKIFLCPICNEGI